LAFDPTQLTMLPVVVLSLVAHECAHGWAAIACGDPTPRERGRMTLHPGPHLDPIGTLLVPGLLLAFHAPLGFGWARPMPVSWGNLGNPRNDPVKVALAGPLASGALALLFAALAAVAPRTGFFAPLSAWCLTAVAWNCSLALLHLIPVPPLDGSWALMRFLRLRHIIALHHFRGIAYVMLGALVAWPPTSIVLIGPVRFAVDACVALFAARLGVAS
jgi:Zn-dependent protease